MPIRILLVLPAFNVGSVIGDVISRLPRYDTLVVDDGSQDNTFAVAEKLGYLVIRHPSNLGLSSAIRTGEQYAISHGYTHILLMDSDGQHPPELFSTFCSALYTSDFVLGDRFSQLDCIPPQKVASNLFASLLVKEVTGIFVRDVSCGYRGYRLTPHPTDAMLGGYCEIYRQILMFAFAGVLPTRVSVPAIYDVSQPLVTKRSELLALCIALSLFSSNIPLLSRVSDLVNMKADIAVQIEGIPFLAQYLKDLDSYIFSTDSAKAEILYGN